MSLRSRSLRRSRAETDVCRYDRIVLLLVALLLGHPAHTASALPDGASNSQHQLAGSTSLSRLYNELYYQGQNEDDKALAEPGISDYFEKDYRLGVVQHIWDFFPDRFTCIEGMERTPTREMVFDGGKWLCGTKNILQRKGCVVYSFGSMGDTRFEQVLLERTRCEIHIFDPSLNAEQTARVQQLQGTHFHAWGLTSENRSPQQVEQDKKVGQLYNLPFIMGVLKHSWVDVLKIDIEGYENAVLQEFYPNPPNVTQLLVEMHLLKGSEDSNQVQIQSTPADVKRTMQALRKADFKVFHREVNYFAENYTCWEYAFIRTDEDGRALVHDAQTVQEDVQPSRMRQIRLKSSKRHKLHHKSGRKPGVPAVVDLD